VRGAANFSSKSWTSLARGIADMSAVEIATCFSFRFIFSR
jgi:hypothetical protein